LRRALSSGDANWGRRLRELAGVAVKDAPRYLRALYGRGSSPNGDPLWNALCNRREQVELNPDGPGLRCQWKWGTDLHGCQVVPAWGRKLMHLALRIWPIRFADEPLSDSGARISFLFAHRGRERLSQLKQTLRSVLAQSGVQVECIVADLSPEPVCESLPEAVRVLRVPAAAESDDWHKAWAFNLAARQASGDILVFQDGDVCVPDQYGRELVSTLWDRGYDVASIQRFLFYLDEASTAEFAGSTKRQGLTPIRVRQNWKGGTIAVRRDAFFALGGFDEGFVDWGGEDDEFFDRCGALGHCRFGYLPMIHLWHPPQSGRLAADNPNTKIVLPARCRIPATQRIAELRDRGFGQMSGPRPAISYRRQLETVDAAFVFGPAAGTREPQQVGHP